MQHLGSYSLGLLVPLAASAQAQMSAAVNASVAEVQAKLSGALEAQAQFTLSPPSLQDSLNAAMLLVANLEAALTLGAPGASVDLTAMALVIAELEATLGALNASLSFAAEMSATLSTPGVHAYRYDGPAGQMGTSVQDSLGGGLPGGAGPQQPIQALVLIAGDSQAWNAMSATFRT